MSFRLTCIQTLAPLAIGIALFAARADQRPNIVLLMAEDIGQDLACYGMKGVHTPNLDRLAEQGRRYSNAICANPICSPNRSAMMVGVHPALINAHLHRSNRDLPLAEPYKPFTAYLREAGYTCLLGHDLVFEKGRKIDCNFKHRSTGEYDGEQSFGLFDAARDFEVEDEPFFSQIQLKATHRGDWWNWMRRASNRPVDVADIELPPYIPDTPKTRLDWATYLDTVQFIDSEVALLENELRTKGLLERTVIIFVGDNGRCNIRGKGYLHEPGLRVPLIIWGDRKWVEPRVVDDLVSVLDVTATILHLAGAPLPDYMEARPLVGTERPISREYVYSSRDGWDEINECMRSITDTRFSYIRNYMPELPYDQHQAYLDFHRPALHEMRRLNSSGELQGPAALFLQESKAPEELYDLKNDPHQINNLAGDPYYTAVLDTMRARLVEWQASHRDIGLEDYRSRKLNRSSAGGIRDWLQKHDPEGWQHLLDGNVGERYRDWGRRVREEAAAN